MIRQKYISYLLLLFSVLMLAIPVMPHHHHANGQICMKDDVHTHCCQHHDNDAEEHRHGCEDTGCIATHFFQQRPANNEHEWYIDNVQLAECIIPHILSYLTPDIQENHIDYGYRESLHGTQPPYVKGLRAPPCA